MLVTFLVTPTHFDATIDEHLVQSYPQSMKTGNPRRIWNVTSIINMINKLVIV